MDKKYYVQFDKNKLVGCRVRAKNRKEAEEKALRIVQQRSDGGSGFTLFVIENIK